MKRRGFTLVEMLTVIVIIGILMVLLTPTIINLGKGTKKATYQNKVSIIKAGAVNYIESNKNYIKGGEDYCVTIEYLIKKGYLTSEGTDGAYIINPETNEKITSKVLVKYEQDVNGVYKSLAKLTEGKCTIIGGNEDDTSSDKYSYIENPELTFSPNGNSIVSKNHSAKITGKEIKNLKYVWSIDANNDASEGTEFKSGDNITKNDGTGDYYLCIHGEDLAGNEYNVCSNAFVFDNTPPTCTVTKGSGGSSIQVTATGSDEGPAGVKSLTMDGTVYTGATKTAAFSKEMSTRTYTYSVTVTDNVGNTGACSIGIDVTKIQGACLTYNSCTSASCCGESGCQAYKSYCDYDARNVVTNGIWYHCTWAGGTACKAYVDKGMEYYCDESKKSPLECALSCCNTGCATYSYTYTYK